MNTAQYFLYGLYPYICLTVFLTGSVLRFNRDQYGWRSGSSQLLRRRQLVWGSNLFHVGILGLFAGHVVGLLTPIAVFDALGISHGAKQLLAVVMGGVLGLVCLAGLGLLLHRRLTDLRILRSGTRMDIAILLLLGAQLLLGLATLPLSLAHPDGASMVRFMEWAQRIVTFRSGAAALVAGSHWVFQAHIVLGLTVFLVFPFSRLVHIWSAPVGYPARRYQVVRTRVPQRAGRP